MSLDNLALDKLGTFIEEEDRWCTTNKVVVYAAITTDAAAKIPKDSDMSTSKSKKAQKKEKLTAKSSTPYNKHPRFSAV